MGGGGGKKKKNLLEQATDDLGAAITTAIENPSAAIIEFGSGGFLDAEGNLNGTQIRNTNEIIGELNGRNAQRKAQMEAADALTEEKAVKKTEIKNEQDRKRRQDVAASTAAGVARNQQTTSRKKVVLGTQEQDFLGL